MTLDGDSDPYCVVQIEGGFAVMRQQEHEELRCADEASAQQYALMLNKAYRFGYKTGLRYARESA